MTKIAGTEKKMHALETPATAFVRTATSELRVVTSAIGRHVFVADGSRIYDLPADDDAAVDLDELARLTLRAERRIGPEAVDLPALQTLSLNVAQSCNMSCGYCYADEGKFGGKARMMQPSVARAAVDRLIEESQPGADLMVGFMGGEPLLARALLHEIVPYARLRGQATGHVVRFSITTNASLMTEADARLFATHPFQVTISIDGSKAANDRARRLRGGGSSHDRILAALALIARVGRPRHLSARATVSPGSDDLVASLDHFFALGFDSAGFSPVVVAPTKASELDAEGMRRYAAGLIACAEKAKAEILARRRYPFSNFETALTELHRGSHKPFPCGAGAAYLSVDTDGDLYACHRLVDDPGFAFGDVFAGSDRAARGAHLERRHVDRAEPCRSCWARYLCGGGCYHEVDRRGRTGCDMIRGWLAHCIAAYAELGVRAPGYFSDRDSYFATH